MWSDDCDVEMTALWSLEMMGLDGTWYGNKEQKQIERRAGLSGNDETTTASMDNSLSLGAHPQASGLTHISKPTAKSGNTRLETRLVSS